MAQANSAAVAVAVAGPAGRIEDPTPQPPPQDTSGAQPAMKSRWDAHVPARGSGATGSRLFERASSRRTLLRGSWGGSGTWLIAF